MEAQSSKNARLKGAERREQIIHCAMKLFSRFGFQGTTMRHLASEAGISEAMIYRHFPSKEALYDAILQHKIDNTRHLLFPSEAAQAKDDEAVFGIVVENFLKHQAHDTSFMRMILFSALEGHELARMFVHGPLADFYRSLVSYLEERMSDGVMKRMDAQVAARLLIGMAYYHTLLREVLQDPAVRDVDIDQLTKSIVDVFCKGIREADARVVPQEK